jgi:hypothetical protein
MTYLKTPLAGFVAGATLAGMLAAGNVGARELSFASGATPNSIGSKSIEVFTNALEERSDGDLTAMPSLTPEGVSEKLSRDWGNTLALRAPSEYSASASAKELPASAPMDWGA